MTRVKQHPRDHMTAVLSNDARRKGALLAFRIRSLVPETIQEVYPRLGQAELKALTEEGHLRYTLIDSKPRFATWQFDNIGVRPNVSSINERLDGYLGGPNVIVGSLVMEQVREELCGETLATGLDSRELNTRVMAWHILDNLGGDFL